MTTKRCATLLASQLGEEQAGLLFAMRAEGLIFHNFQPLTQVSVREGGCCSLGWNPEIAAKLRLNTEQILASLSAETKAAAEAGRSGAALRARASQIQWRP